MSEPRIRRATEADIPGHGRRPGARLRPRPLLQLLTGDAPERNLRMRMGWAGILRRASAGLREALLSLVLERADAAGTPTYLEATTAHNVLLYERHGFEVVEELILPRTDVRGSLMLRAATSAGTAATPRRHPNRRGSG